MKTITYRPSRDELQIRLCPTRGKPARELGKFKFWWDDEGNICALRIKEFAEQLKDFKRDLHTVRLGGIWKGVEITDEDIRLARQSLLKKLEEKF